jgi:hypothetical protein
VAPTRPQQPVAFRSAANGDGDCVVLQRARARWLIARIVLPMHPFVCPPQQSSDGPSCICRDTAAFLCHRPIEQTSSSAAVVSPPPSTGQLVRRRGFDAATATLWLSPCSRSEGDCVAVQRARLLRPGHCSSHVSPAHRPSFVFGRSCFAATQDRPIQFVRRRGSDPATTTLCSSLCSKRWKGIVWLWNGPVPDGSPDRASQCIRLFSAATVIGRPRLPWSGHCSSRVPPADTPSFAFGRCCFAATQNRPTQLVRRRGSDPATAILCRSLCNKR